METSEEKKVEMVREVAIREFDEELVELVPYTDSIISSSEETTVRNYLNLHVQMFPELMDAIDDGIHTFEACWKYITESIRKLTKSGCAMVGSDTVFRMVVNFYASPVVEREKVIEKPVSFTPSGWDPEKERLEREQRERIRKEEERRKKLEEDVRKNGPMLFDFC